jgi:peptidoglycan/xylan/chitin deacetylase (PgdA/CDA1 family)
MRRSMTLLSAASCAALALAGCGGSAAPPAHTAAAAAPSARSDMPTVAQGRAAARRFAAGRRPLFCGGRGKPWVALTFDDGPGPYTPHVIALLRKYRVPATFFVVGRNTAPYRRELIRERSYNAPIGNHSWSHPLLTSMSGAEQLQQLASTKRAIEQRTGQTVRLLRPPYGAHDAATDRIARRLGMAIILWNVDSRDALGASSKQIARRVKAGLRPGSIILLHENRGQTVRALHYTILPALRRSGMKPVTVPEMLAGNPPTRTQLARGPRGCGL